MTASARAVAAALQRAGMAAAVLAIIAGIFGMHVMTGNHAAHENHTAAVPVYGHGEAHAGAGHAAVGHQEPSLAGASASETTSCAGTCQGVQASGTSCIPSAKTGALTVFPPHETGVALHGGAGVRSGRAVANAYTPPGPTPGELSISRT